MIADTYIKISRVVVNDVQARIIPDIRVRRRREGGEKRREEKRREEKRREEKRREEKRREEKDGGNIQVLEELPYGVPFTPWPHIVGGHMKVEDVWISHSRYGDH